MITKYKILIADDHEMIREGIKMLLRKNKEYVIVGEAVNGNEAIEKYNSLSPDLLVIDISMPELNGMEASKQILANTPDARIIILSMYDSEEYISKCIEYGIKGYVVKNESANELDYAMIQVLSGRTYFSNRVQQVIIDKYTITATKQNKRASIIRLTAREKEIVNLIAIGMTSQQIADKLFISPRTVETHRANLMKKVNVKNSIELVNKLEKDGII